MELQKLKTWLGRTLGFGKDSLQEADGSVTKDPVCGMEVEPAQAAGHSIYRKRTYYFCSIECQEQFDKDPVRFAYEPPRKRGCC